MTWSMIVGIHDESMMVIVNFYTLLSNHGLLAQHSQLLLIINLSILCMRIYI